MIYDSLLQNNYADNIEQVSCFTGVSGPVNYKQTWKDDTEKHSLIKNLIMICLSIIPVVRNNIIISKTQKSE